MNATQTLYRSERNKMIGGVCAGLAAHFGVDVTLVRLGAVLLGVVGHVPVVAIYLILWAIMPVEPRG
jgi:phage shock protein PspC (stress-responsive transcriptional regulator)